MVVESIRTTRQCSLTVHAGMRGTTMRVSTAPTWLTAGARSLPSDSPFLHLSFRSTTAETPKVETRPSSSRLTPPSPSASVSCLSGWTGASVGDASHPRLTPCGVEVVMSYGEALHLSRLPNKPQVWLTPEALHCSVRGTTRTPGLCTIRSSFMTESIKLCLNRKQWGLSADIFFFCVRYLCSSGVSGGF